jgi:hypothetical protein
MIRILMGLTVFLIAGTTVASAQPAGCYYCGNHWWYNEHIHGNDLHRLYDNAQNHGGEWYPYYCGNDHRECGGLEEPEGELLAHAIMVEELLAVAAEHRGMTAELLERLSVNGVVAKLRGAGLTLLAECSAREGQTTRSISIPLSDKVRAHFASVMVSVG